MSHSTWTTREIRVLRQMYPSSTMDEIQAALKRHPIGAIRQRAHQLGLRRARKQRDWAAIIATYKFTFDLGVRTP